MANMAMIEDMLRNNPLSLLSIKDEQVINQLNNLIPYSTGFDIECHKDHTVYNELSFKNIPDIMDVSNDNWEQRYRIPNGLKGIICLYNLSIQLKINSLLNPKSSIHYHVDCTDCIDQMTRKVAETENGEYILSELDTWLDGDEVDTKSRVYGSWYKFNSLGTVEFRLGEMTFEYRWLLKRVIHCNKIVKKFKDEIKGLQPPVFEKPDAKKLFNYERIILGRDSKYKNLLSKYSELQSELGKEEPLILDPLQAISSEVRNRVTKITRKK